MAKKRRERRKQLEPLESIKRLLILSLAKQGATTSEEVARVLETVRRQGFWDGWASRLTERLAHQFGFQAAFAK